MNSYQMIEESYDPLVAALQELLPSGHACTVTRAADYPLLVMEGPQDAAGFAIVNGSPAEACERAYAAYKMLYRLHHEQWSHQHLSFVVLRASPSPEHNAFFARIEADPFFCRKYVLRFDPEAAQLRQELLRLPFIPLPLRGFPGSSRPPSAQALLQGLGVSAARARDIVVPRQASAHRLLDSALEAEQLPDLVTHDEVLPGEPRGPIGHARLRSVAVEGFRAYNRRQVFDLDCDVVVLYGPNGLGKTSLFHAVDYACTGRIGRLSRGRIDKATFVDFARHLGAESDKGEVTLELLCDGESRRLQRRVDDWSTATVDGTALDRPKTLEFLTSAEWGPKRARIENLERLFRATHFFDQSEPELFLAFGRESVLPADLVSRTLAMDDYASAIAKIEEVLALLETREADAGVRSEELLERMANLREERGKIPEAEESLKPGERLQEMATALADDIAGAVSDIEGVDDDVSASGARDWRALLEGTLNEARSRFSRLRSLEEEFAAYEEDRSKLATIREACTAGETALEQAHAKHIQLAERLSLDQDEREEVEVELAAARRDSEALDELAALQSSLSSVESTIEATRRGRADVEAKLTSMAKERESLLASLEELRERHREDHRRLGRIERKSSTLKELAAGVKRWRSNRAEAEEVQKDLERVTVSLTDTREKLGRLQETAAGLTEEIDACDAELAAVESAHSSLTRLLDELEAHVGSASCPACGTDHESRTALLDRIRARKDLRPQRVDDLAVRRRELQGALSEIEVQTAQLLKKLGADKQRTVELEKHLGALREDISSYEESLRIHLGTIPLEEVEEVEDALRRLREETAAEARLCRTSVDDLVEERAILKARLDDLETGTQEHTTEYRGLSNQLKRLEQRHDELTARASALDQPLNLPPPVVQANHELCTRRLADLQAHLNTLTEKLQAKRDAHKQAELAYREAKARQTRQEAQRNILEKEVEKFEVAAGEVGLAPPVSMELVSAEQTASAKRVELLRDLVRRAMELEGALDAATRSARVAQLDEKMAELAADLKEMEEKQEDLARTDAWFSRVHDVLSAVRSEGVANHVRAFGPLATLLQKRLRPVYGFGDVTLQAKGSQIAVLVERDGRKLRPTDFFSDSQRQILMLSLFLATRLTQSWSGFAPILLDDPVTHFDDLNAFAFVEVMRGLVDLKPGELQFIVSTCEERLFDLMRDKLGGANTDSKFYRFEGIDSSGPIVRTIPA